MCLNKVFRSLLIAGLIVVVGCSSAPPPPVLSVHEQLIVDTEKAKSLLLQFEKQIQFESKPAVEKYLQSMARQIAREEEGLRAEKIAVRIHRDSRPEWKRNFSFPGVVISIPESVLYGMNFENELAALVALELARVERRELALTMEKNPSQELFGERSVFKVAPASFAECIDLATKLMYSAGYDPRGMVTLFQHFSEYYLDPTSAQGKKELALYVKQAQKAKNEFMPSLQPIVRSNGFLRMKKDLKDSRS